MLLCSSKIPVTEKLTMSKFVDLAVKWVLSSRNYNFDSFAWNGSSDEVFTGNNGELFQVSIFEEENIGAIHFSSTDNRSIKWTTDFILSFDDHVLAFQLYREAPPNVEYVHRAFSIPSLVNNIIEAGFAASDNGIDITGKPIIIHDDDADWIKDILLRNKAFNLPLVYLSCVKNTHCVVNPYMLAEKLNGVAHVIYETSRSISFQLYSLTNSLNPYGGAVEIIYPRGNRRILPSHLTGSHNQKVYYIVNAVFNHLNQIQVEDRFSWSQLQAKKLHKQLSCALQKQEQESQNYSILETTYEEIIEEKENRIKQLSDQLASANTSIEQLEIQLASIGAIPVIVLGEEADMYPNEQKAFLVEIIDKELKSTPDNTRKNHVLQSLLAANRCENTVEEKRKRIKACLHGYTKFSSSVKKELSEIGFSFSDDGKHIKIVFGEDFRYIGVLSKTGSDHRGGDNTAHDLIRLIF